MRAPFLRMSSMHCLRRTRLHWVLRLAAHRRLWRRRLRGARRHRHPLRCLLSGRWLWLLRQCWLVALPPLRCATALCSMLSMPHTSALGAALSTLLLPVTGARWRVRRVRHTLALSPLLLLLVTRLLQLWRKVVAHEYNTNSMPRDGIDVVVVAESVGRATDFLPVAARKPPARCQRRRVDAPVAVSAGCHDPK